MATPSSSRRLKILLVGDKNTGKRTYMRRLIENKYPRDSWTNKLCDDWLIKYRTDQNTEISIQISIIRGCERGRTVLKKYYQNSNGYMIMFDVTNAESYDNIEGWKKNIDAENKGVQLPCIVLATKCDLEKDEGINQQMQGIDGFCEAFGFCGHFETSSKDNIGIQESFKHFISEIMKSSKRKSTISESEVPSQSNSSSLHRSPPPPPLPPQERTIKLLVIGELGTGKTAVIQRYVKNVFSGHYRSTIGADIAFKKLQHNNDIVNVQIWDIAGDERFGSMTHLFYKDAAGCLIVFDESKPGTLTGAIKWKDDFDNKVNYDAHHQIPCVLVGNKCDLPKEGIVKSEALMADFCQTHQFLRWFETSAKDNTNISDTFIFVINKVMETINNRTGIRQRTTSDIIRIHDAPIQNNNNNDNNCCNN